MKALFIFGSAVVLCLGGCAKNPALVPGVGLRVASSEMFDAPDLQDNANRGRSYQIGPGDKISVEVFGVPDLSRELVVDGSGHVGLPLIGEVDAQGQTPVTLAAQITERFRARFVRNPRVSVNIIDAVSQVITLDGEIRAPGLYPVVGKLTLVRAIAQAKGMTENARVDQVVVFRTVKGQRLAALFDLQAIRQGTYADPEVYANDVVVVGDSPARRLFRNLLAASPLLTTPLVILSNRL